MRGDSPTSERELFAGYASRPNASAIADTRTQDHALAVVIEERITELWRWRTWDRAHLWAEWTTSRRERTAELRALVRLARKARTVYREIYVAEDPIDVYKAGLERGLGYHEVQAQRPRQLPVTASSGSRRRGPGLRFPRPLVARSPS
jgi:hypothetical protein